MFDSHTSSQVVWRSQLRDLESEDVQENPQIRDEKNKDEELMRNI